MIDPDELIFVVDQNNNPLQPLPRKIAHKNNFWHRTTGIWVINSGKQVLCQKRSMRKDQNPGKQEAFFGGHLGPNEDFTESAAREISEELGQTITVGQFVLYPDVGKSDKSAHKEFQYIFVLILNKDVENFQFEKEEIDQLEWVSLDELKKILLNTQEESWVHKSWDSEVLNWIETLKIV